MIINIKTMYFNVSLSWKRVGPSQDTWTEKVAVLPREGQVVMRINTNPTDYGLGMWRKYLPTRRKLINRFSWIVTFQICSHKDTYSNSRIPAFDPGDMVLKPQRLSKHTGIRCDLS